MNITLIMWSYSNYYLFCFHSAFYFFNPACSAKLIEIYRNRHNISASIGLNDPAVVATGIADLVYETEEEHKEPDSIDPDLAMAWAAGLEDGVWDNNSPAMTRVRCLDAQVS